MTAAYGSGAFSSFVTTDAFHQLPESRELYDDAYTVLAGQWPTESDELVLIVDSNGSMQDLYEYALGLRDHSELDEMMEEYYSGSMGSSSSKPDLQFRVIFRNGDQSAQRTSYGTLSILKFFQSLGSEVVCIYFDGSCFATSFDYSFESLAFMGGISFHCIHQIGNKIGTALIDRRASCRERV